MDKGSVGRLLYYTRAETDDADRPPCRGTVEVVCVRARAPDPDGERTRLRQGGTGAAKESSGSSLQVGRSGRREHEPVLQVWCLVAATNLLLHLFISAAVKWDHQQTLAEGLGLGYFKSGGDDAWARDLSSGLRLLASTRFSRVFIRGV